MTRTEPKCWANGGYDHDWDGECDFGICESCGCEYWREYKRGKKK